MSSKSADCLPALRPEDPTPGNRIVAFIVIAFTILVGAIAFRACQRPEPVQMIPSPMPAASSAAIASSSAQAMGTQGIRVAIRPSTPTAPGNGFTPRSQARGDIKEYDFPVILKPSVHRHAEDFASDDPITLPGDGWEIVIEATQSLVTSATSSAQASASVNTTPAFVNDHGHLGVIATTMPGLLAADLQLLALDASPVTRWLVNVPLEVGLDVAGNLEAGAAGVSIGSKAFAGVYGWSRWNLAAQGSAVGVGLRF